MNTASTTCRVKQCSKCPGDTEFYCRSCSCAMCKKCKENHEKNLKTINHNVATYCDKFNHISKQEICVRHSWKVNRKYCESCQVPACDSLSGQSNHKILSIRETCKSKQQQHRETIHTIRSEALFYRPVLLTGIKTDLKTCQTKFSLYRSEMITKAETLKNLIDIVQNDFMYNVFCDFDFMHRCLKQSIEMSRYIASLQIYLQIYEQSAIRPLQFLSSLKTARLPQIHLTLHTSQFSMTESFNKEDVMMSLSAIQIAERGNRRVGNECLLKLTSGAELHQSLTVTGVRRCLHISCVTSDRVWVSDNEKNLVLSNTAGETLHHVKDSCSGNIFIGNGLHTVNSESELIYIDRNYNIKKLSKDMKTTITFIEREDSTWTPRCVYLSPSSGDLLVAMYREYTETPKVTRYNQSGQLTQTIQHDNTGLELYKKPIYITENNNGDIVLSVYMFGSGDVVVTERGGKHRFSYTGHPSGSELVPRGICTDALSHILVCDDKTNTVQMIDKDGQFLSHLLIRPSGIIRPQSLSYDVNNHRLWAGSGNNNKLGVYNFIERQGALRDLNPTTADVIESLSYIPTTETEKPQQRNQCLLKLMSGPELNQSLTVTGVHNCGHISCVTLDWICVSDRNNLILINTIGVPLHRVEDSCSGLYGGLHTVNSESELIYIDRTYNINKLSKDMKTTTRVIERTDSTWEPQCVYLSPSTGDLLVGMFREETRTGKVTRHDQCGKLTQTYTIRQHRTGTV